MHRFAFCFWTSFIFEVIVQGFFVPFFFVLLTEEFRFPVHAWVCRYYTYVRVFVNVHTMRFAILLHRQAFMYIHVHVLRGFQTYILLFSNLFSSASFFLFLLCFLLLQLHCSVCPRMPLRKDIAIEFCAPDCYTCIHMCWLYRFSYKLFRYTSSLTESFP